MLDRGKIKAIGGSNIAALLNESPYESAHSLYLRLTGEMPPKEDSDVMRWGRELESRVADIFADGHEEYEVVPHGIVTHTEYDFLIASPDRVLLQNNVPVGVLEVKTADISTRHEFGEPMTDEIPFHYLCQVIWYLGMLNLPVCHVAVYFRKPGRKALAAYQEYVVEASPEHFAAMVQKAVEFWFDHVEKRVPPEITEADNSTISYYRQRNRTPEKEIVADNDLESRIKAVAFRQKDLKEAEELFELEKIKLIAAMGDAEVIVDPYSRKKLVSYKGYTTTTTDYKGLLHELGIGNELIDKFQKKSQARRFTICKQ
jgi:putative phage-type endonuclease